VFEAGGARVRATPLGPEVLAFGSVPDEYAAATARAALFDATTRGNVTVTGADAAAFLHRITANAVRTLAPGAGSANLLLNAKGKVLHTFQLLCTPQGFELSTEPGRSAALLTELDRYLFSERVALADATDRHAPLELCGPEAFAVARAVCGIALPTASGASTEADSAFGRVRAVRCAVAGSDGLCLSVEPERVAALWHALVAGGATPAGRVVRDILRVEAGAAEWGADIDENVYPQEARLEPAFSLDKGCYIGQEVVAKIDTYGGLNKRLVGLRIPHDDPIARGTPLSRHEDGEWRELGLVTSWAYSFALDTGLALAYVKRRHQEPGTRLRVGDGPHEGELVALPVRALGARLQPHSADSNPLGGTAG
jgi:folate-binding protein YgfZ